MVQWARINAPLSTSGYLLKTTAGLDNLKEINTRYYVAFATRFSTSDPWGKVP